MAYKDKSKEMEWRRMNRDKVLEYRKKNNDKINFAGKKEIVFKRDNYTCQYCGRKEDLTIHHIDGNGRGKINKNNNLNNLLTLCRKCHGSIDGKRGNKGRELKKEFKMFLEIIKSNKPIKDKIKEFYIKTNLKERTFYNYLSQLQ